ncbi:TIGR03088 family PEP-CTERM/XrtA system glycosyltransferase [Candidatus Nitrosacidococcus tergens]|uniref:Sugar transferase, PEP-CTERM/EpsH1 system associated n=1 Tax=Candidatus Nitrosacidococcus tergens TaxID=553981 RepID=A0A7G1QBJ8_9GAMM|nr:TIGR03088 family PEP-CTERM/XrtA system glycosyltransferase [Candidatus Nitrosacidococcus tergens]CAB1276773.1 Sugar transferase, PEP-CTERM/EpsH1 system associated [Candidatus Nitrosacidococcus tergens]
MNTRKNHPIIVHIIFRLQTGGLENGLVNIINHTDNQYQHHIVCIKHTTEFSKRLHSNIPIYELHKKEGRDLSIYAHIWKLLRNIKPDIVHTRNLAALEMQIPATLAGVKIRIHGEHGWDIHDPEGKNWHYRLIRRLYRPFVHRYIALSQPTVNYLHQSINVPTSYITPIYNGVDTERFFPNKDQSVLPSGFADSNCLIIGTVGRLEPIKNQITLIQAFINLVKQIPDSKKFLRLIIVGEGSLRSQIEDLIKEEKLEGLIWLAGDRKDIPTLLQSMDIFVLPSLAEGISNTILEAMATGLPVIATHVGGNPELVTENTGILVPKADSKAVSKALATYINSAQLIKNHGQSGRKRVKEKFAIQTMVDNYINVYNSLLAAT